jgi:hypothetical protein
MIPFVIELFLLLLQLNEGLYSVANGIEKNDRIIFNYRFQFRIWMICTIPTNLINFILYL